MNKFLIIIDLPFYKLLAGKTHSAEMMKRNTQKIVPHQLHRQGYIAQVV